MTAIILSFHSFKNLIILHIFLNIVWLLFSRFIAISKHFGWEDKMYVPNCRAVISKMIKHSSKDETKFQLMLFRFSWFFCSQFSKYSTWNVISAGYNNTTLISICWLTGQIPLSIRLRQGSKFNNSLKLLCSLNWMLCVWPVNQCMESGE